MTTPKSITEVRHQRLQNSWLTEASTEQSLSTIVTHLLGIQAQYSNAAVLNLFNRTNNIQPDQFQDLLADAPIVKAWGNRQTLHLFTKTVWREFVTIFSSRNTWVIKHLQENNLEVDEVFDHFHAFTTAHPQFSRDEIFAEFGDQAPVLFSWSALFLHESMNGRLYMPAIESTNTTFVACPPAEQQPLLPLLQRYIEAYFTAYGPATIQDFVHFTGLSQKRLHIEELDLSALATFELNGNQYYGPAATTPAEIPELIMLCKFDPLLIGYADKSWLTNKHQKNIWHTGGQIEPVILINGDLVGTWRYQLTTKKLNATVDAYKIINQRRKRLIKRRLAEYAALFGREPGKITYTGKMYGEIRKSFTARS